MSSQYRDYHKSRLPNALQNFQDTNTTPTQIINDPVCASRAAYPSALTSHAWHGLHTGFCNSAHLFTHLLVAEHMNVRGKTHASSMRWTKYASVASCKASSAVACHRILPILAGAIDSPTSRTCHKQRFSLQRLLHNAPRKKRRYGRRRRRRENALNAQMEVCATESPYSSDTF